MGICAALSYSAWPNLMKKILDGKSTEGKFCMRDQIHFFIMFVILLVYATGFNFIGSHLWGCFVGGLSFTSVPHSHHLWVNQTKRPVKWMIRVFFACTVGFSIPIDELLSLEPFLYGMVIGAIPCLAAKVFCAPFMGDARWVIGWGMCGRAEFAYYIAAGAVSSQLMDKEVYAITIWSLLCATVLAPFIFRVVLKRYTQALLKKGRLTGLGNISPEVVQQAQDEDLEDDQAKGQPAGVKNTQVGEHDEEEISNELERQISPLDIKLHQRKISKELARKSKQQAIGQSSETENETHEIDGLLHKNNELTNTVSELQRRIRDLEKQNGSVSHNGAIDDPSQMIAL
jgi:hypothetical protein